MKKIIHKLKKNRLVSKIAALLTICLILVSSFTVSSFAADEEEATNSITDVWTGVTDSIISLFGLAQGVFLTQSGDLFVLDSSDIIEVVGADSTISYFSPLIGFDPSDAVFGVSYDFSLNSVPLTFEYVSEGFVSVFYSSDSTFPTLVSYSSPGISGIEPDLWYFVNSEPFSGTVTLITPFSSSGSGTVSLTFLGILAVVGVSIALIMLLVYVISRFLRLRG